MENRKEFIKRLHNIELIDKNFLILLIKSNNVSNELLKYMIINYTKYNIEHAKVQLEYLFSLDSENISNIKNKYIDSININVAFKRIDLMIL